MSETSAVIEPLESIQAPEPKEQFPAAHEPSGNAADNSGFPPPSPAQVLAKLPYGRRITRESAKEMAARSHNARRARLEALEAQVRQATPETPPEPRHNSNRLRLVGDLIERAQEQLQGEMEPRERASLMVALDKILDRERVLKGEPLPGSHRPSAAKAPKRTLSAGPLDVAQTPEDPAA